MSKRSVHLTQAYFVWMALANANSRKINTLIQRQTNVFHMLEETAPETVSLILSATFGALELANVDSTIKLVQAVTATQFLPATSSPVLETRKFATQKWASNA
jgi:hypothetical protein